MTDLMLRLYDGYTHTSPQLRDTVRELQAMLRRHDRDVVIDGLYGRGTEGLVRTFQQACGLRSDGALLVAGKHGTAAVREGHVELA